MKKSTNIIVLWCADELFCESRLDSLPEILKNLWFEKRINIILSGWSPLNKWKSEAERMFDYLIKNFPNIFLSNYFNFIFEKLSKNTWENIYNSFEILLKEGFSLQDTFIVTNSFHTQRTYRITKYFSEVDFFDRVWNFEIIATEDFFKEKEEKKFYENERRLPTLEKFEIWEKKWKKLKVEKLVYRI